MSRLRLFVDRVLHRGRFEAEMEEEMRFHVERREADLRRGGLSAVEARRRARLEFGGWESHKDGMRSSLIPRWLDDVAADIRFALRTLNRSRLFTAIAVGSLALAIGANTNIFSVANQVLYLRLGVPHPEQLRALTNVGPIPSVIHSSWGMSNEQHGERQTDSVPYTAFRQIQAKNRSLEGIAGYKDLPSIAATVNGEALTASLQLVSGNLYDVLEVKPQLGRAILPSDEDLSAPHVATVSDRFWRKAMGARADAVGSTIRVEGITATVVGVNPKGFTGAATPLDSPDVFVPLTSATLLMPTFRSKVDYLGGDRWWVNMIGRAKPGVSDAQAAQSLTLLLANAVRATGTVKAGEHIPRIVLNDGSRGLRMNDTQAAPIYVLLSLTLLVLLLACANIANLMLARTTARMKEMSVRLALGASRARILRQIVTESLLLSIIGGVLGLALGYAGRNGLLALYRGRSATGVEIDVHFDWRVFAFTAGVTIATGLLFGILPAWRATQSDINSGLKETGPSTTRRRGAWSGRAIVGVQITLSMLLVATAALFVRTLWNLNHVDPGYSTEGLVEFDIDAPVQRYHDDAGRALMETLQAKLSALPGIGEVSVAEPALLDGSWWSSGFEVEGLPKTKNEDDHSSVYSTVGPEFFHLMGIRILRGRDFASTDTATSTRVSIINASAAKKFFPGLDPIGRRFSTGEDSVTKEKTWYTVVGICADTQYGDLRSPRGPIHFDPLSQTKDIGGGTFLIRSKLPSAELVPMLRRTIASVDNDLPLMNLRTADEQIANSLRQERLFARLTAGFGVLALMLAVVGIYGVMAYTVSQRTNEIGIRLALGARRMQVRLLVLREVAWITVTGVGFGLTGLLLAMRSLKSLLYGRENLDSGLLYGMKGVDVAGLTAAAVILAVAALMAGWIPAERASRVEPMKALRHE